MDASAGVTTCFCNWGVLQPYSKARVPSDRQFAGLLPTIPMVGKSGMVSTLTATLAIGNLEKAEVQPPQLR